MSVVVHSYSLMSLSDISAKSLIIKNEITPPSIDWLVSIALVIENVAGEVREGDRERSFDDVILLSISVETIDWLISVLG